MLDDFVEYTFQIKNTTTLVFIPGFSGGLDVKIISSLIDLFSSRKNIDVLGLNLPYKTDIIDDFDISQKKLVNSLLHLTQKFPHKKVYLVAKSLGGALSLFNLDKVPVKGLTILGCSIVLGWPQRISLLSSPQPIIPDYKKEWQFTLQSISTPVTIISGEKDDLSDNLFLLEFAKKNDLITVNILANADHNLRKARTDTTYSDACIRTIDEQIKRTIDL